MTSTTEPPRAVMMHPDTWKSFSQWATAVGLQLKEAPHAPGQTPRYTLSGTPERRRSGGDLSQRELEVLTAMSQGLSNKRIGARLFLAEDTVKTHAKRLYRKLGVSERAHAVSVGHRLGLLGGDAS